MSFLSQRKYSFCLTFLQNLAGDDWGDAPSYFSCSCVAQLSVFHCEWFPVCVLILAIPVLRLVTLWCWKAAHACLVFWETLFRQPCCVTTKVKHRKGGTVIFSMHTPASLVDSPKNLLNSSSTANFSLLLSLKRCLCWWARAIFIAETVVVQDCAH